MAVFITGGQAAERKYRYIRFRVDAVKDDSKKQVQLAEIQFFDDNGAVFSFPAETVSTSTIAPYADNQSAAKTIDGSLSTKFCSAAYVSGFSLDFDLGEGNEIDIWTYCNWQWYTAEDASYRDPVTFSLYGSVDGEKYVLLDAAENVAVPEDRNVVAYKNTLGGNSVPDQKQYYWKKYAVTEAWETNETAYNNVVTVWYTDLVYYAKALNAAGGGFVFDGSVVAESYHATEPSASSPYIGLEQGANVAYLLSGISNAGNVIQLFVAKKYERVSAGQTKGDFISTVASTDPSAYPENGVQDGFWYVKIEG